MADGSLGRHRRVQESDAFCPVFCGGVFNSSGASVATPAMKESSHIISLGHTQGQAGRSGWVVQQHLIVLGSIYMYVETVGKS